MKVLIIGGTGLISVGIVKHLLERGADVTMFNRGKRDNVLPEDIEIIHGDRNEFEAFEAQMQSKKFDVVIDMIGFNPKQAESDVRAFAGRCEQFIFCSTVCTYGVKVPPGVLVDETFPQEPISGYGRDKVACERIILEAHDRGQFNATIIRPSSTYGEGGHLIDNLEFDPVAWDRIEKGKPVLCSGDGLGLWNSTHRDDCGKLFAYAAGNSKTFGEAYNATTQRVFTWRDLYREAAQALGKPVELLFMPADWIVSHDAKRFGLLKEITQFHGAYTSAKAMRDVPEFKCEIDYIDGAKRTLDSIRERGAWKNSDGDEVYEKMVRTALDIGVKPVAL